MAFLREQNLYICSWHTYISISIKTIAMPAAQFAFSKSLSRALCCYNYELKYSSHTCATGVDTHTHKHLDISRSELIRLNHHYFSIP